MQVTAACFFLLSLFFAPLFGAVPEEASAPVLVLIGSMMMQDVGEIKWSDSTVYLYEHIPAVCSHTCSMFTYLQYVKLAD